MLTPRSWPCQDPLGLGSTEASLSRFQESEVIHGRWAMLGVAGALAVEILGLGNWFDAPLWVSMPFQSLQHGLIVIYHAAPVG